MDGTPENLESVTIQFSGLDRQVVVVFKKGSAARERKRNPNAAIWAEKAFRRFVRDMRELPLEKRQEFLVGVNLVKSIMGGSYEGLFDRKPSQAGSEPDPGNSGE